MNIFDTFHAVGIIPVVEIYRAADAMPLAEAPIAGGQKPVLANRFPWPVTRYCAINEIRAYYEGEA